MLRAVEEILNDAKSAREEAEEEGNLRIDVVPCFGRAASHALVASSVGAL